MAIYKTLLLNGAEEKVNISGQNCDIRNDGADIVYASRNPSVVAGADGVLSVPVGGAAKLLDTGGTVYLLGTGSVQLCGNDYSELVFKSAATSSGGGGTVDDVARAAISTLNGTVDAHTGDDTIHLTAEKAIEAAATTISNPNLLDNPDFKINQRGKTEYTIGDTATRLQTVDRWVTGYTDNYTVLVVEGGIKIPPHAGGELAHQFEDISMFDGKTMTASMIVNGITYSSAFVFDASRGWTRIADFDCGWGMAYSGTGKYLRIHNRTGSADDILSAVKLEYGPVATPFVPPLPATELAKCQRYYQIHTTGDIDPVDLRPSMRISPTVTELDDGNYAYNAEF